MSDFNQDDTGFYQPHPNFYESQSSGYDMGGDAAAVQDP